MSNCSRHPIYVEYAIRSLFTGQSPKRAASTTAKKHNHTSNIFANSQDLVEINPAELEEAVWERLVDYTVKAMASIRPGREHYALDGTLLQFSQKPTLRKELKARVLEKLRSNPFPNDDK